MDWLAEQHGQLNSNRNSIFLARETRKRGYDRLENVGEFGEETGKEGNPIILSMNPQKSHLNLSYVRMEYNQTSLVKALKSEIRFE